VKESYKAFVTLLNRIDAPHIIISYPSNGILSIDELYEIISLTHRSIHTITIGKMKKGGKASFDKKGVSEHIFITGDGIKFSLLMPQGIEIASKIGRIDSYSESIFSVIHESFKGISFIKGIIIHPSPSYKVLATYSESELDEILHILENHVITDSYVAINQIMDVYTQQFLCLSSDEKVRLEKKCLSLLRYMVGYEKERLDEVFGVLDTYLETYKDEMSTRETFLRDLENVKKGSFVR